MSETKKVDWKKGNEIYQEAWRVLSAMKVGEQCRIFGIWVARKSEAKYAVVGAVECLEGKHEMAIGLLHRAKTNPHCAAHMADEYMEQLVMDNIERNG